jgi:hypothetical protein
MQFEFSENLNRLLRNSLTVETPDSTREIALPRGTGPAASARFNQTFTMTPRRNVALRRQRRRCLAFA